MSDKKPATYADLEALPENVVGEIIDGELFVSPRPRPRHGIAHSAILGQIHGPFQPGRGGPGGWWIITEPELHLGRQIVVPDIAGWRRERLPTISEEVGMTVAPDWLCEVLSPSTARLDRAKKLRVYATHQVEHVWLVDPVELTLEVYLREGKRWLLVDVHCEDDKVRIAPFEAIELDLSTWWLPASSANEPGPTWRATTG